MVETGTDTIAFEFDGATITVKRATIAMGLRRSVLRDEQMDYLNEHKDAPLEERYIRLTLWPALIAATIAYENMWAPKSCEEFMELPDNLGELWSSHVFDLNPHWRPGYNSNGKAKKKEKSSA
jgi:hypothetical protein